MKKIFSIILIAFSLNGLAQDFPGVQSMSNSTTRLIVNGGLDAKKGIINGNYTDTTQANAGYIDFHHGAQIWTTSDKNFWLRDSVLNMWVRMAKFSEVGSSYTANLPARITGTVFSVDTSVAFVPSLTTNARLKKIIDSLSAANWGVPTLQQILAVGDSYANDKIYVGDQSSIHWDVDNDATSVTQFNQGNNDIVFQNNSTLSAVRLDFSALTGGTLKRINFPDFTTGDYFATVGLANAWTDGIKQTFNPNGTNAGINVGSHTADPSSLANGDLWYNSTSNELKARINGSSVALGAGGGGGGTVTSVSRTNGFGISASVADPTTTPNITIAADTTSGGVQSWVRGKKIIDSLQAAGWGPTSPAFETRFQYWMDVSGSTQANFFPGGSSNTMPSTAIADGWVSGRQLSTLTSTTGGSFIYFGATGGYAPIAFTSAVRYNYTSIVRLSHLSDGTETFHVVAGFGDEANEYTSNVDGAGFRYAHPDSSGTWIAWTKSNSTTTEDATDITVAADTDYDLWITVIGGTAYFYINNVLKATIATNVPSGIARQTSSVTFIKKSAGTTARLLYVQRLALGIQKQ